jgi:hypothetical protein
MFRTARWATAVAVGGIVMGAVTLTAGPGAPSVAATSPAGAAGGPMIPAPAATGITDEVAHPVALSTNWSGYAATSASKLTSVQADFVQPSIVCTGAPARFVSAWVGLDGFRDSTVEQDGTYATCTGKQHRTPTYVAWYEMFPLASVDLFSVNAGDEIRPAVAYAGGAFTLTLTDVTTGQAGSFSAPCKSCRRASAEWIVERPELCTKRGTCFLSALPDFATVSLTGATAGTGTGAPAPISSFSDTPIDMIQPQGVGVELLDQTNPLGTTGDDFSATWERAGGRLPL